MPWCIWWPSPEARQRYLLRWELVCPIPVKQPLYPHRWTMVQQQKSWKHTFMAVVQSTVLPYFVTNLVAILKGK